MTERSKECGKLTTQSAITSMHWDETDTPPHFMDSQIYVLLAMILFLFIPF